MKRAVVLFLLLVIPSTSFAFKYRTHTWIAQQVINDVVDDGLVTIETNDGEIVELPVSADIVNALRTNPSAYRYGNIGPDNFPDILSGQFTVHTDIGESGSGFPGGISPINAWNTDDWLKWVYSEFSSNDPESLAFKLGYLGHAASDMFAHTYVNQYAGDVFWLNDGEQNVEQRHVILERYIDWRLPKLIDHSTGLEVNDYVNDLMPMPSANLIGKIRDGLILNQDVALQYSQPASMSTHLNRVYILYQVLKLQSDFIESIYFPPTDLLGPAMEMANQINDLYVQVEDKIAKLDELLADVENADVSNIILRIAALKDYMSELANAANATNDEHYMPWIARIDGHVQSLTMHNNNLVRARSYLDNTNHIKVLVPENILIPPPIGGMEWKNLSDVLNISIPKANDYLCDTLPSIPGFDGCWTNDVWETNLNNLNELNEVIIPADIANLKDLGINGYHGPNPYPIRPHVVEWVNKWFTDTVASSLGVNIPISGPIDLTALDELLVARQNLFEHIKDWKNNIEFAMDEWVKVAVKNVQTGLKPNPSFVEFLEPYDNWMECHLPLVLGLPKSLTLEVCADLQAISDYVELIDNGITKLTRDFTNQRFKEAYGLMCDVTGSNYACNCENGQGGASCPIYVLDQAYKLQQELPTRIAEAASEFQSKYTGLNFTQIINMNTATINDATLMSTFGSRLEDLPNGGETAKKGVFVLQDVLKRIKPEMGIEHTAVVISDTPESEGYLDPRKYPVIYNALQMVKLTLLDKQGLNSFAKAFGVENSTVYGGSSLYDPLETQTPDNIILGVIRNLDGNHQWNPAAPPLANTFNSWTGRSLTGNEKFNGRYGHYAMHQPGDVKTYLGLRIFEDPIARNQIFSKIFKGPLAAGIQTPRELDPVLPEVIPAAYPFRSCSRNPFPRTISDTDHFTTLSGDKTCLDMTVGAELDEEGRAILEGVLNPGIYRIPSDANVILGGHWYDQGNSSYVLTLQHGTKLIVDPGARLFMHADSNLIVEKGGVLEINGLPDNRVSIDGYGGVSGGIYVAGGMANITYANIENQSVGIAFHNNGSGLVQNTQITDNLVGLAIGSSSPHIYNNSIANNQEGIRIRGQSNPVIKRNDIVSTYYNVTGFGYYHADDSAMTYDLTENWWGTVDPAVVAESIFDNTDYPDAPTITYLPFSMSTNVNTINNLPPEPGNLGVEVDPGVLANGILAENEPYQYVPANTVIYMNTELVIPQGVTLTLEEGTEIYFKPMKYLDVNGTLRIQGTQDNKVVLASASGTYGCAWMGVNINGTSTDTIIDNAIIKYGCEGTRFKGGTGNITNTEYTLNYKGITIDANTAPVIENSKIHSNGYGFYVVGNNNEAQNPSPSINNNVIQDNYYYDFYAQSFGNSNNASIGANGNFWGTTDTFSIDTKIYDATDNYSSPVVNYSQYLLSAP